VIRLRSGRAPHAGFGTAAFVVAALAFSHSSNAQVPRPGTTTTSVTASVLSQLDADIDKGGRFNWWGAEVNAGVTHAFTPSFSAGVTGKLGAERWSFDGATAFGASAPWGTIERPSVGLNFGYRLAPDLSLFVAPQVEWAYESGASASDAMNYGAVFGVTKFFSPDLVLGLGAGAFRQIDRNFYFPFIIVNWKITDSLRLTNPLQAGPTGGAGLELAYAWTPAWELAAGAAFREYRFRLRDDGPTPNGLGQNQGVPLFLRLTRSFGPAARVDLYAGVVVGGELKLVNAAGATVQSSSYGAAPLLALSGTFRF
jgi:hypothetical protein